MVSLPRRSYPLLSLLYIYWLSHISDKWYSPFRCSVEERSKSDGFTLLSVMIWDNNFAPKLLRYILLLEKKALVKMLNIGELSAIYFNYLFRE